MLLPKPKRQTVERRSGLRAIIERIREVGRLGNVPRRLVQFDIDFDDIALADPGGGAIGGTDPYKSLPAHCRHPAAPGVPVDRDRHGWAALGTEHLDNVVRHLDACSVSRRNDLCPEFHLTITCNVNSAVPVRPQARQGNAGGRAGSIRRIDQAWIEHDLTFADTSIAAGEQNDLT